MRWLLVKDLQILRRSPFLVALLVAYPVLIAVLIGLALSKGPDKPKVAFLNQVPAEASDFAVGNERLDASKYADELFKSIDPVRVSSREEALAKVRDGEALGALIIPADIVRKLQGTINLAGLGDRPPRRGDLQRRGPDQGAVRRVHDQGARGRRQQGAQRQAHRGRRPGTSTCCSRAGSSRSSAGRSTCWG